MFEADETESKAKALSKKEFNLLKTLLTAEYQYRIGQRKTREVTNDTLFSYTVGNKDYKEGSMAFMLTEFRAKLKAAVGEKFKVESTGRGSYWLIAPETGDEVTPKVEIADGIFIDPQKYKVFVGETEVPLSFLSYKIFEALAIARADQKSYFFDPKVGGVAAKELNQDEPALVFFAALVKHVWPTGFRTAQQSESLEDFIQEKIYTLRTYFVMLREQFANYAQNIKLENSKGQGYYLEIT
jgi:hypothetical protein